MKQLYLSLMLAGFTAAPAMAQETIYSFPKPAQANFVAAQAPQLHLPSAINDKEKGITMYAGQRADQSKRRGWVKWQTGDTQNFTKLYEYINHPGYNNDQGKGIVFGAYDSADDSYYAFFNMQYTLGYMPTAFAKVNIATGDTTNVVSFAKLSEPDAEQNAWYAGRYKYCMAFDPVNEAMYALGADYKTQEIDGEEVTVGYSVLYEVNVNATSVEELFTKVKDFDAVYWDFAFDAQGNAYFTQKYAGSDGVTAVGTQLVKMDGNFNIIGDPVKIKDNWGSEVNADNFSPMAFDWSTGDLYYSPCNGQYGTLSLYKINPETGIYEYVNSFFQGNHFVGLYIPYYTAADAKAPARVSNLDAQAALDGAMADTIKWTNPTTSWDRSELTNLKSVKIYRKNAGYATTELTKGKELLANSQLLAEVDATEMGAAMSWVDDAPVAGMNTYYVLATNDKGNGVLDSIRCYMGIDVPGEVNNISLAKNGEGVDIAWEAPEKGANNGYISSEGMTYKLTRLPDNVVVAENLADTKFTDNTLGEQQLFSYQVQAKNEKGEGAITESEPIMAGSALKTPIKLTFDSRSDADRWTVDPMHNSLSFYYPGWDGCDEQYRCFMAYGDYYGNNVEGTIVSPPLYLEEGKTYRFTTDIQADFYDDAYFNFYTAVGTNGSSQEGATIIGTREGEQYAENYHRQQYEDYFTAPSTGTFYYSIKVGSDKYNIFRFFGLNVDYVAENDMRAISVDNALEAVANSENTCDVRVRNIGSKEQSGYTVKLVMDNEGKMVEVGSTTVDADQTLKSGEYADVQVKFNPPYDGVWDFYGVVLANGDEDHSNDTTAVKSITVLEEGSQAWTNIVNSGLNEALTTTAPIKNYAAEEYSQSVYYPSEINTSAGVKIRRLGWMYDGNDDVTDRTNPVDIKVYLAHTDLTAFSGEADKIADSERELVYEGQLSFEPGANHLVSLALTNEFEYNNEQNLVVICEKSESAGIQFCALWHVFNNSWAEGVARRTLLNSSGWNVYSDLPVLYLGIYDPTKDGVERIQLLGSDMAYADGMLAFDKVVNAEVYTIGGKLVSSFKSSSAQLNLAKGMYIVRATDADGNVMTKKINVK